MSSAASVTARYHNGKRHSHTGITLCRVALMLLLSLGVLAFGATEPWSLLTMQLGSVVVLLTWIATSWRRTAVAVDPALAFLMLFGALVLIQLGFHRSAYNYASQQAILAAGVTLICFILGSRLFRNRESRLQFSLWGQAFGGLLAIFAIVQAFAGNGKIFWLRHTSVLSFFGPYANRNHYAGVMEMMLPFALVPAALERTEGAKRSLLSCAAALMLASAFLSRSRTGILVVLSELLLVSLIAIVDTRHRLRIRSVVLAAGAIALAIWLGGDVAVARLSTLRHFSADSDAANRWQIARDSLHLIREKPILGWGFGTFSTVYPRVSTVATDSLINAAHDDYLQLLVETGAAGVLLILTFLFVVFRRGLSHVRSNHEPVVAAALLGCSGLLLHSFTDFNVQIPANAAIFFALCGLICASNASNQNASSVNL